MSNAKPFCVPSNCGYNSTTTAVARRLGRLLDSLALEINSAIVNDGPLLELLRATRLETIYRLELDGWSFVRTSDRFRVIKPTEGRVAILTALRAKPAGRQVAEVDLIPQGRGSAKLHRALSDLVADGVVVKSPSGENYHIASNYHKWA